MPLILGVSEFKSVCIRVNQLLVRVAQIKARQYRLMKKYKLNAPQDKLVIAPYKPITCIPLIKKKTIYFYLYC